MLGLVASASSVLQLDLIHMRPIEYWLKLRVPPHAWHYGFLRVKVNQACVAALAPWKNHLWMERGVVCSDSMTVESYINHQGGLSLKRLFILAECLLRWAQLNLRSLRVTPVPGKLNLGADILSRRNVPSDE